MKETEREREINRQKGWRERIERKREKKKESLNEGSKDEQVRAHT